MTTGSSASLGVVVLGMHRSGTSALTRVLSLLGLALPKNLMPPVESNNATGFWEPQRIARMNDRLLAEGGSDWRDWRSFDLAALDADRLASYRTELQELFAEEYAGVPLFVLKDPRISRFLPFYVDTLAEMGIELLPVHCHRHPAEVVASLAARDGFTPAFSELLWLRHELSAEAATRGRKRVFVSYEGLMADWRTTVMRMGTTLALDWPIPLEAAAVEIESHLSPEHRHHAAGEETASPAWTDALHAALRGLEADPADGEALREMDRIRAEFEPMAEKIGPAVFPELHARERKWDAHRIELDRAFRRSETHARNLEVSRQDIRAKRDAVAAELRAARDAAAAELRTARAAEARNRDLHRRAVDEIRALRSSSSWRLTGPLREASRLIRQKEHRRTRAVALARIAYHRFHLHRLRNVPLAGHAITAVQARMLGVSDKTLAELSRSQMAAISLPSTDFSTPSETPRRVHQLALCQHLNADTLTDPSLEALQAAEDLLATGPAPTVSVIVPAWNRETTIRDAVASALEQSYAPHEVIVSDDGSTDDTLGVLEDAYPAEIASGQLKLVRNSHRGVSQARNAALAVATGELFAYLDSDNVWRRDYLLMMAAAFAESDEVATAYAGLAQVDTTTGQKRIRGQVFDRRYLLAGNFIDMNVFVHRRFVWEQLGGFREDMNRLVDWELILRFTKAYVPAYLPFIGVDYNLGHALENITYTRPLEENYAKVALTNRPERIRRGVDALRLAYFVYDYPALSQTFVLAEIRELLKRGIDLKVYFAVSPDSEAEVDFDVDTHQVANADELARLLVAHGRNVCHSHFAYPGVTNFVRPACRAAGVHYTFMPHAVDIFHEANRVRSKVGELGADPLCLKVFVYGDHHRRFLEAQGVPCAKIAYTFQAVDLTRFEDIGRRNGAVPDGVFRIVAIGRFIEKKGFVDLVRAMGDLPREGVALDLYGYGPLEEELAALVAEHGLTNVALKGPIHGLDALADVYASADLLAAPCIEAANGDVDGFPTVILEAMVAGVPVLATTVSAIPDYIRDGVEGVLVPPRDPAALARAIDTIRQMPAGRRQAMIARAQLLVSTRIGVEKTVTRLLDTWTDVEIDIVLVTYNTVEYDDRDETREIIDRILERTTTRFTLTIVDNGSDDAFWDMVSEAVRGRGDVRLIRKRKNVFCGPATNLAVAHGTAEFVIYLCSKEAFIKEHGWERRFIDALREDEAAALAGHICYLPQHVLGREFAAHPAFPRFRSTDFALAHPERRFGHVQGGAKVMRRSAFEAVGGYNAATPQDHMDVELAYHLEAQGHRLASVDEVASVTTKTLPGLGALLDEQTVVAHPFTIETVHAKLDGLKDPFARFCNLCETRFPDATVADATCPTCGALPFERSVYRVLAAAPYIHRGGRLAYLGPGRALAKAVTARMFRGVTTGSPSPLPSGLSKPESYVCVIVDTLDTSGDVDWEAIAGAVEAGGEIIVADPFIDDDGQNGMARIAGRITSAIAPRGLVCTASACDRASVQMGYDWRRLWRIALHLAPEEADLARPAVALS